MPHLPQYARLALANNPGPMTLEGTNSWVLQGDAGVVVVDPGPSDPLHLERLTSYGKVLLILLTHGHADHAESAEELSRLTGAPVSARDPLLCRASAPLDEGDQLEVQGLPSLSVMLTMGHTRDSVSFLLDGDEPALVTGDTLLGRGSTVVAHPDGRLGDYLASLHALAERCPPEAVLLPGHGPAGGSVLAAVDAAIAHRAERLDQVRQAIGAGARTPEQVLSQVYTDIDAALLPTALLTVRAQLDYLEDRRSPG